MSEFRRLSGAAMLLYAATLTASCTLAWGSGEFTFVECRTAQDCPATGDDPCIRAACTDNQCAERILLDEPLPDEEQTAGDCMQRVCDAQGSVTTIASDTDIPVDGDACTDDVCQQGVPDNPPAAQGTSCPEGVCNGSGSCVSASCDNNQRDGDETDIDCGGSCPDCGVGQGCEDDDDCRTTVCDAMVCAPVNDCDPTMATDLTGMADVTITWQGNNYNPACIRVSAGTLVTFSGNFNSRPMLGGKVVDGEPMPAPRSPFNPVTDSGSTASFELTTVGVEPYHCTSHYPQGMFGAIFVE